MDLVGLTASTVAFTAFEKRLSSEGLLSKTVKTLQDLQSTH